MTAPSGHCVRCGVWRERLHRDHIVPKWAGGTSEPSNIQLLCANCHEDKTRAEERSPEWSTYIRGRLRGRPRPAEVREKIRLAHNRPEALEHHRVVNLGNTHHLGKKHSPAVREKMSQSRRGHPPSFRGPHSEDTRKRMSQSRKAYLRSQQESKGVGE